MWNQHTVFLDFFSDEAAKIWSTGLKDLYELVPYDGLWLDMNEVTGFCDGECPEYKPAAAAKESETTTEKPSAARRLTAFLVDGADECKAEADGWYQSYTNQDEISTYKLPFIAGPWNLDNMTASLNATHPSTGHREYDVHSLFGLQEGKRTRDFLLDEDLSPIRDPNDHATNRTLILSRSTFAGSGAHTQHWLGDNHRSWDHMNYSIAGIMNFNMFGIPFVGPDTCGFFENPDLSPA